MVARPCVFLDRDGVINVKPAPGEYIRRWEEIRFIPETIDWIRLFKALGFLVIVVTNQRGVALGLLDAAGLAQLHERMRVELSLAGAVIDDIYSCVHEKDSCGCRKPRVGMVSEAVNKWGIDQANSIVIGDSDCDRELARACGMRFIHVDCGRIVEVTE